MSKEKSDIPEIEPWELKDFSPAASTRDDLALGKIVRESYREPIQEDEQLFARIDGQSYRIIDIGSSGVGIAVSSLAEFPAGTVCAMQLHIGGDTIVLEGTVAHTSPSEKTGEFHCGVKFTGLDKNSERILQKFLTAHHASLFGALE